MNPSTPIHFASLPALGKDLNGGTFAGVITRQDGTHCAVVLLPNQPPAKLTWQAAMDWAQDQSAELPTRPVAALRAQPATTPREASDFQKWSVLAYRALDDAGRVLMTVEPECSTESDNLSVLTETIRELMYQALTLNGVLSRRDMDRKFQFCKLDSDALLRAQPASGLQTAIRLVLDATPDQLPMAIDALRDFATIGEAME